MRLVGSIGIVGVVLASWSAVGVGGVVAGSGLGTLTGLDQSWACEDTPFQVDVVYLPGNKGIFIFRYVMSEPSCPALTGGGAIFGEIQYDLAGPSANLVLDCDGTEAQGLYCDVESTTGEQVVAWVGPHNLLGPTFVRVMGASTIFDGDFLAP